MKPEEAALRVAELVKAFRAMPKGDTAAREMLIVVAERLGEIGEELAALRQENAELREQSMRYRGTWSSGEEYTRGQAVTRDGALWHCRSAAPTTARPGDSPDWSLMSRSR